MTIVVKPSPTVVQLPATIVGEVRDSAGNVMTDESGNPIIGTRFDLLLSTVYALAYKIDKFHSHVTKELAAMSATQADIDDKTATILADVAALGMAATNIQAEIAALKAVNPAINTTALDAAVASLGTAVTSVGAIAPAAPPPT